jgi:hypothetical protein
VDDSGHLASAELDAFESQGKLGYLYLQRWDETVNPLPDQWPGNQGPGWHHHNAWGQFFISSFAYDKKIEKGKVNYAQVEAYWGAFLTDFFSFFMIVATAATLFVHGIPLVSGEAAALGGGRRRSPSRDPIPRTPPRLLDLGASPGAQRLARCPTAALGGPRDPCVRCGYQTISYNSCRHRHCPKCQTLRKERWIEARGQDLLPVQYFHVVFTIPAELNPLVAMNQRVLYNLLFQSASETLLKLFGDDRHPLSVQRAQNILGWVKDPQLAWKWQKILVPHMQTTLLKRLRQHPTPWTDLPLVEKELIDRGSGKKVSI